MKTRNLLVAATVVLAVSGLALCQGRQRPRGVNGTLVKVDGQNLVVKTMARGGEAKEVTVATDGKTEFVVDAEAGKLADLKADMRVMITPDTGTAQKVRAFSKGLMGTVVKVDGKNVVIKAGRGEAAKEVTVATDEKTKVIIDEKAAKLEDLKTDMRVTVLPETGTAMKIIVMGAGRAASRPGGPRG